MRRAARQARVVALGGAVTVVLLMSGGWALGLRVNLTPSLPIGLYIRDSDGELVEFCPVGTASAESAIRGYRARGVCDDGHAPLLKPIAARPGDVVEMSAMAIAVNGERLPNTQSHDHDHRGRALQAFPPGQYQVEPHMLWVVSTWNDGSYDSRYFGPIRESMIRQRLRPLWVLR